MVAGRNQADAPEAARVAKRDDTSVVEVESGAIVVVPRRFLLDPERTGHAQVQDELTATVEAGNQVLATSIQGLDAVSCNGVDVVKTLGRVGVVPRLFDAAAADRGRQLAADRLDLG